MNKIKNMNKKILLDSFKIDLLMRLIERESTINEIAREMNKPPAVVAFNFKQLEEANLIKVTNTVMQGKRIIKYYRAISDSIEECFKGEVEIAPTQIDVICKDLKDGMTKAVLDKAPAILGLVSIQCSPDKIKEFKKVLKEVQEKFGNLEDKRESEKHTLVVGLYSRAK